MINCNSITQHASFPRFAEDYNTATFKNPKYYDLSKWQSEQKPGANDDPTLTDEERVRLERKDRSAQQSAKADDARIRVVLDNLREAKKSAGDDWKDIEQRATDSLKKPTFESIAAYAPYPSAPARAFRHCITSS
jgi:hypothetical protein